MRRSEFARPMAGLPCLSRDQEQRRARGMSTCRAPIHHLQNGSRTRHRSQQLVLSRSPLRLVRAGLVGVGVQVSPGLASAAAAAHAIVSFAHIISSEGRITPSCPAASPRAHDSFSPKTTRPVDQITCGMKVSRDLCARLWGPATCRAEEMRERPRIRRAGRM